MDIEVTLDPSAVSQGILLFNDITYPCALGRGGAVSSKQEGDGATPIGRHPLREVFYRADRITKPVTRLPARALEPDDGWCDAPGDPNYNCPVRHPYPASAERLWRDDGLYDLVVVIGYNDAPAKPGAGSAIFLHVAATDFGPTEGCVALARAELEEVLAACGPDTHIVIREPDGA